MKIDGEDNNKGEEGEKEDPMKKNFTTVWDDSQLGGSILDPTELVAQGPLPNLTSNLMDKIESSVKVASNDNEAINELFVIKNIAFKESGKKTYEFIDLWLYATELSEEAY